MILRVTHEERPRDIFWPGKHLVLFMVLGWCTSVCADVIYEPYRYQGLTVRELGTAYRSIYEAHGFQLVRHEAHKIKITELDGYEEAYVFKYPRVLELSILKIKNIEKDACHPCEVYSFAGGGITKSPEAYNVYAKAFVAAHKTIDERLSKYKLPFLYSPEGLESTE